MRTYLIHTELGNHHPHDTTGELHDLQALVGGYIETVPFVEFENTGIIFLANEEGLLKGLPINENMTPYFLVGNIVAVGDDGEDWISLTDEQIRIIQGWLTLNQELR